LFGLKGYNGKHLVRQFPSKSWNVGLVYQLLQKLWVTGLVDRCCSSSRWCNTCTADNTDLVDELLSHKNGQMKNNICTLYGSSITTLLSTKNYHYWLISVEDTAS